MGKSRKHKEINSRPTTSAPTEQKASADVVQKPLEMLLIGASSSDPFSTIVVDPRTGVSIWSYKGSELQGAAASSIMPLGNTGDHLLLAVKDRPLLNCIAIHNRDRFHAKSVVAGPVNCFVATRDATLLFAAIGSKIHAWLLSTGEMLSVVDAHYQSIARLALSGDESLLISASQDGAVHVYIISEILSREREKDVKPIRKWQAHTLPIKSLCVSQGQDSRIATCGADHIASIYSISLDVSLLKISADRPLTCCALDPAESRFFVASDLGNIAQINLYNTNQKKEILIQTSDERNETIPVFNGHSDEISALRVNGDGAILASADVTGKYCLWEIGSRQCLRVATMRGPITTLSFLPNWRTFNSTEYTTAWRPVFDLQRNPTNGATIQLTLRKKEDNILGKWTELTDKLIESKGVLLTNKKQTKVSESNINGTTGNVKNETGEQETSRDTASLGNDSSSEERVNKLIAENRRLRKINAELYSFSAKQILNAD